MNRQVPHSHAASQLILQFSFQYVYMKIKAWGTGLVEDQNPLVIRH